MFVCLFVTVLKAMLSQMQYDWTGAQEALTASEVTANVIGPYVLPRQCNKGELGTAMYCNHYSQRPPGFYIG